MRAIYSYTGRLIGPDGDVPSLQDIAVQEGRLCRYAGAGIRFWPVLLHSIVVAELLPPDLKAYGLLHDAGECVSNDVPSPVKAEEHKQWENPYIFRIFSEFGLPVLSTQHWEWVKLADALALRGEVWTVGNQALQQFYQDRDKEAENLVLEFANRFPPMECISPDGLAVVEFIRRFRDYKDILEKENKQDNG